MTDRLDLLLPQLEIEIVHPDGRRQRWFIDDPRSTAAELLLEKHPEATLKVKSGDSVYSFTTT